MLRKTDKFISKEKWLEAAKIWKGNIASKEKKIAAKSMFNMALASEMEGYLDTAIDWAVKRTTFLEKKINFMPKTVKITSGFYRPVNGI